MSSRFAFALAAVLVPAAAQADPFCNALKSILITGEEAKPFASVKTRVYNTDLEYISTKSLPGFTCAISADGKQTLFSCRQPNQNGAKLQADITKQIAACIGGQEMASADYPGDTVSDIKVGTKRDTHVIVRWSPSMEYVGVSIRITE